jgi:hypothetical protein
LDFGAASPFLNDETDKNDARLFAAIFQAQAEDFPDLPDYCRTDWEDPGSEAHWNNELLDPMICRWCDFDPQAALVWVRQHLHTMDGRPHPFGWAVETDRNKWIALVAEMARANGREGALAAC